MVIVSDAGTGDFVLWRGVMGLVTFRSESPKNQGRLFSWGTFFAGETMDER
jgi:hypothetical protein